MASGLEAFKGELEDLQRKSPSQITCHEWYEKNLVVEVSYIRMPVARERHQDSNACPSPNAWPSMCMLFHCASWLVKAEREDWPKDWGGWSICRCLRGWFQQSEFGNS